MLVNCKINNYAPQISYHPKRKYMVKFNRSHKSHIALAVREKQRKLHLLSAQLPCVKSMISNF